MLTPKGQRVFLVKIASKQPLLKARQLVQNEEFFWYFQLEDLVANLYSICTTNLRHSFLTICEIITFEVEEKVFFLGAQGGQQCFEGQNNHYLK
jgi:hypothetical protein